MHCVSLTVAGKKARRWLSTWKSNSIFFNRLKIKETFWVTCIKSANLFQGIWTNNFYHTYKGANNGRYAPTSVYIYLQQNHYFTLGAAIVEREKLSTAPRLAQLTVWRPASTNKIEIIKTISPKWQEIGDLLDFDGMGQTIEQIRANENRVECCCRAMFKHWLEGNGRQPATWAILIEILEDCNFVNLATDIRNSLSSTQYAVDIWWETTFLFFTSSTGEVKVINTEQVLHQLFIYMPYKLFSIDMHNNTLFLTFIPCANAYMYASDNLC